MHVSKAKTTHSASPTPPKARKRASLVASKSKRSRDPQSSHLSTTFSSHLIAFPTTAADNIYHARLTIPLSIAIAIAIADPHILLPPPNPRVPAQDSLASLAPQRQHQWLRLFFQRLSPATTQPHEQRKRRVNKTTPEQLYFQRACATALLKTRHQARPGRQPGCAHGEAQGDVFEEGSGGEGGQAV
jgi:hypothetical protein